MRRGSVHGNTLIAGRQIVKGVLAGRIGNARDGNGIVRGAGCTKGYAGLSAPECQTSQARRYRPGVGEKQPSSGEAAGRQAKKSADRH